MNNDNPIATITNNSGVEVEIFDVYNHNEDSKGNYTYTSLGTLKAGDTKKIQTIHFASQLQAMYTGLVSALNNNYYYQFPVAVFGISALSKVTTFTISGDDKTGMEQAFNFIKYSTANAESKLTKDFLTAVGSKDQETAVDAFFASTGSFKKCTMKSWTAVVSWQSQFTSAWQGPYYLYNQPAAGADVKLIAVVNITSTDKANAAVISMANADGTVTSQSETATLMMAGGGTMSEQNVGTGCLSVTLQPVWMNVIQTKKDGTLDYLIGAAMSGTVNGIKITGTQQSRTLPDSKTKGMTQAEKDAANAQSEKEFDRNFSKITTIVGLLSSLGMLIVMVKQMKQGHTEKVNNVENKAGSKPDKAKVEQEQQTIDKEYQTDIQTNLEPEITAQLGKSGEITTANKELVTAEKQAALEDVVDGQVEKLTEVLENEPPTDAIEKTAKDLMDAKTDITSGDFDAASAKVTQVKTDLDAELASSGSKMQEYEKTALEDTQEAIKQQQDETDALEKAETERDNELEQDPTEDVSSDSFDPPETDPIEIGE